MVEAKWPVLPNIDTMKNPTEERLVQMLDIPLIDEPKNSDVRLTSPRSF